MKLLTSLIIGITIVVADLRADDELFRFEFQQLSPDVWAGVRADSPRFPVMGNTTFVVGDEGVVVFDGGGAAAMADQIIAKVRSLTDKPVTHVVISHWHGDHNFGVFRFAEEFPNVKYIAHEFTRDVINSTRISYVDRQTGFFERNGPEFRKIVETGMDSDGIEHSEADRKIYQRLIEDADVIEPELARSRVTPPDIVFTDKYTIQSGSRRIELLHLGHANTAGDIVMWLPDERIVATGDIVVLPSPYAFNVPPRPWAATLRALNDLDYKTLVPGHGDVQTDTSYVDLVIEVAEDIASQRDSLLARDMSSEDVEAALDFSAHEERFTRGDEYAKVHYDEWFETPLRKAAMKALTGEPMVAIAPPENIPFDDERWQITAAEYEVGDYLGQQALKIKGGSALLPDLDVANGLVEFDIAVSQERGFAGLMFRVQDEENFEHFYVRPHQSGNPDANQYTPVFNGVSAWQLYHGAGYGAPVSYRYGEWMHVKIIYAGSQAEVYIDSDRPVLHVDNLRRGASGGAIGLSSANFSAVHFANFKYTSLANAYVFPALPPANANPVAGVIDSWEVSDSFDGNSLLGTTRLSDAQLSGRTWTNLEAETTGITNLARVNGREDGKDTVFARLVLTADTADTRQLALGYSDKATVFVNGELVYRGDNTYMSRDYRYLGTIGLFDSIALPLEAGENEIWVAVTEAFGGWGIMGRLQGSE